MYHPNEVFDTDIAEQAERLSWQDPDYIKEQTFANEYARLAMQTKELALEASLRAICVRRWAQCKLEYKICPVV